MTKKAAFRIVQAIVGEGIGHKHVYYTKGRRLQIKYKKNATTSICMIEYKKIDMYLVFSCITNMPQGEANPPKGDYISIKLNEPDDIFQCARHLKSRMAYINTATPEA